MIARRRSFAVGAAVVAACSAGVPALAESGRGQRTAAQNHRAAIKDAGKLLGLVRLPAGTTASSQEPAGDGGVLANPALTISAVNLVDQHAWWTVDQPMSKVFDYEQAHPPAGGTPDTTCGGSGRNQPSWTCVGSSFSPRPGVLGDREVVVEMADLGHGRTGIRADAEVQWIVPRAASEVVPSGAREVEIRAGKGRHYVVTDRSQVGRIIHLIDQLPVLQPGVWHCPAYRSGVPQVRFAFRGRRGGPALARASVRADVGNSETGCDAMGFWIRGHAQPALVRARHFLRAVGRLLGVTLTQRR